MDESSRQALYRKWRSRNFDDLVGQEPVVRTLRNAVRSGKVAHAYLFAGPRGTGKTSLARILAKAVNCLAPQAERPCDRCAACTSIADGRAVDVVEIDAASNRGVDDIRSLRDKVNFRPAELRYKVYIIDEVHQLTKEAFNALLKTLEEPPPHTLFVLATTHPQDVPSTIMSRCQRFEFRRIPVAAIVGRLKEVAEAEGIQAEPAALELIAQSARGSLRDALSLLDQVASSGIAPLTATDVASLLGLVSGQTLREILSALGQRDLRRSLEALREAVYQGADLRHLCKEILEGLRQTMVVKAGGSEEGWFADAASLRSIAESFTTERLYRAIRAFVRADTALRFHGEDALPLELAVIEALSEVPAEAAAEVMPRRPASVKTEGKSAAQTQSVPQRPPASPGRGAEAVHRRTSPRQEEPRGAEAVPAAVPEDPKVQALASMWSRVLEEMRIADRRLEALLKSCQPVGLDDDLVSLGFFYEFHQRKVDEPQNRQLVEKVISKVLGRTVQVKTLLTPRRDPKPRQLRQPDLNDDELVRAVQNLFNARIVSIDPE